MSTLEFDTTKVSGMLGLFCLGTSFAGNVTAIITGIEGPLEAAIIALIVSAVFLGIGTVFLWSSKVENSSTASKFPLYLLSMDTILLSIASIITTI